VGAYYFVEKSLSDKSPPLIVNLSWTPTRENLDKIYDINVTFVARDDKTPIAYAELRFIPVEYYYMIEKYGMRPEDYPKVFPPDKERDFVLTPVDGKFDSLEEKFSVPIKDIVGGREYKIVVLVRDSAGNERTAEVKTPYIRQFENIAKTDDIIVIADYYFGYRAPPIAWRNGSQRIHVYMPLLGEYDTSDPIVIDKHIDWATGHGIDAFAISWWGNDLENPNPQVTGGHPYDLVDFEETFLRSPLLKDIKFFILYENTGRLKIQNPTDPPERWVQDLDDPFNRNRLLQDFEYISKYFKYPSYLRINGKPVIIFDYTAAFRGNISNVFSTLRTMLREKGYEVYLINDIGLRSFYPSEIANEKNPHILQIIDSTDAIGYTFYMSPDAENIYKAWHDFALKKGKDFLPYFGAGFEPHPFYGFPSTVPYKTEIFERTINNSIKYNIGRIIGTRFNAWYWGSHVEPTQEYEFLYLELIKKYLKKV
jgi:hypothetical protein